MDHADIIYVVTETDKSKYAQDILPNPEFFKKQMYEHFQTFMVCMVIFLLE